MINQCYVEQTPESNLDTAVFLDPHGDKDMLNEQMNLASKKLSKSDEVLIVQV